MQIYEFSTPFWVGFTDFYQNGRVSLHLIASFTRKFLNHATARRKLYKKNSEPRDEVSRGSERKRAWMTLESEVQVDILAKGE